MAEPPLKALNVFLLKNGTDAPEDALRQDATDLVEHRLRRTLQFKGAIWLAPQRNMTPAWQTFLEDGTSASLGRLYNASTSAVLFVRSSRRWFAFTFGYGRSLLRPSSYERWFGLRVVLNTVDPEELKSVDSKTIQEITVQTRRQVSRGSRFEAFSLDKDVDLLAGVAGEPRDTSFASVVAGADALHFRSRIEFVELADKCARLLKAYKAQDYKSAGFGFVDHVHILTDPTLLSKLETQLMAELEARTLDHVHLAAPEMVDWTHCEGFSYSEKGERVAALDVKEFFDSLRKGDSLSIARLKRQHVYQFTDGNAKAHASWSAYSCLVAEVNIGRRRYVLSGGDWYEIDRSFVDRVRTRLGRIKEARLGLPEATDAQHEKDYNKEAAKTRGVYLCDRKCLRLDGSQIELCDLYTAKKQFVHIKRWDSSATLSHLFAQGMVSAEAFLSDETFREKARELLVSRHATLGTHIPKGRPNAGGYQVVYAIIKSRSANWRSTLPFFSQLHLIRAVEHLNRLGFETRIECINIGT